LIAMCWSDAMLPSQPSHRDRNLSPSAGSGSRFQKRMLYFAHPRHMLKRPSTLSLYGIILLASVYAIRAQEAGQTSVTVVSNSLVQEVLGRAGSPSSLAVSFQNVAQVPGDLQEAAQKGIFASLRSAGGQAVKPAM